MARLRSLPPLLAAPASRVSGLATSGTGFARSDGLTTTQRGYGADWQRTRAAHLRQEPHCRFCLAEGLRVRATDVDHIRAFRGVYDPLRLDPSNLRSLCSRHHRVRTARQSHGPS